MRNLAGDNNASIVIQEELLLAGIPIEKMSDLRGEVPTDLGGKLGEWTFKRAWSYWCANAERGLPLPLATMLHQTRYPVMGQHMPWIYGEVVRAGGDCTGPPPSEQAVRFDMEDKYLIVDPDGRIENDIKRYLDTCPELAHSVDFAKYRNARFVPSLDGIEHRAFVNSYHIDTLLGLKEFANTVQGSMLLR